MKHRSPRARCEQCGKPRGLCDCVDICQRCLHLSCSCGETDVTLLDHGEPENKYQLDDDVADDLRRDYETEEPPTDTYWHGYNYARKVGKKGTVRCPYRNAVERKQFFRGVSDARYNM